MKLSLAVLGVAAALFSEISRAGDFVTAATKIADNYVTLLGCERNEINPNSVAHVIKGDEGYGLKPKSEN